MTVNITTVEGPNDAEFLYYRGTHSADSRFTQVRSVTRASLVSGALTKDDEKAALTADVEQMYANYIATQE